MMSLEEKMKNLEEKFDSLEKENERLKAVNEIQNLMGRYRYWHTGQKLEEIGKMFAKDAPGVRVELANSGVYEGYEGAQRIMVGFHSYMGNKLGAGMLEALPIASPVIEVARDGKTAQGLWTALGFNVVNKEGTTASTWSLEEYAVDFIKEDGIWKFWHFRLYFVAKAPFNKSWGEADSSALAPKLSDNLPAELQPDRPTTYHNMYSKTADPSCGMAGYVPPAPLPYDTWDESMASVK